MKKIHSTYLCLFVVMTFPGWSACKKLYAPKIVSGNSNYLVVEGFINTGSDSTVVRLSRTVNLSSAVKLKPETGAMVSVITDGSSTYQLTEAQNGYYRAPGLNSNTTAKYGVKIITADHQVYQSDLVAAKNSPPIDSIYYRIENNGLQLYADTHDPKNSTHYYRWDYYETYIYHTAYNSDVYFTSVPKDTILPRSPAQQVFYCWGKDTATNVIINSTAVLSKDIISKNPITFIPGTSPKIAARYSILVRQYALTPDAYNYYRQLKNNTENIGTIFDPQPSVLTGNIRNTANPAEPVIGYISAGVPAETRIFIDNHSLLSWLQTDPYAGCQLDTDLYSRTSSLGISTNDVKQLIYAGFQYPIAPLQSNGVIIGYQSSTRFCVDCTLSGTNIRPNYWTDYQPNE